MTYTLMSFSSSLFLPNRNIKIKTYKDFKKLKPLSLKLMKGFGFTKVDIYTEIQQLSPCKLLTLTEIQIFSMKLQKFENRLKVFP